MLNDDAAIACGQSAAKRTKEPGHRPIFADELGQCRLTDPRL